ncbi:MAG: hypothetical protein JNG88_05885 [Phycisphaerales bacterium]|nr:hypothetical protein [Phycisphaerales bacterium]
MAVEAQELRRIHWTDAFGFVRILQTLRPSLGVSRLLLGTICVLACWLVGWTLDRLWLAAGEGVLTQRGPLTTDAAPGLMGGGYDRTVTELDVYAHADRNELRRWKENVKRHGAASTGPFHASYAYFGDCFAAGINGVFTGRILIDPDGRDSLLGAVSRTLSGVTWLVAQRPWFTALYGLMHILLFSLFGTAICRQAAVQSALRGRVEMTTAFRFAKEKINETALVPLILIGLVTACAAVLVLLGLLGGLVSLIPVIGHLVATSAYLLALLVGIAAAALIMALILGIHLVCPSMGAEGSDWSDTLTRAIPYFLAKPWHFAFYSMTALAYGAFGFVVVRFFVIIVLKFAHKFTAVGMGWFGMLSGSDKTLGRLPTMWQLPAWSEITLLPTSGGPDWWGTFFNAAQMSAGENAGAWVLSAWVGLMVAAVGGFVVSYYFTVCTEIYLLLRRHVDGTPIEDVFYEDPELEYGAPTEEKRET